MKRQQTSAQVDELRDEFDRRFEYLRAREQTRNETGSERAMESSTNVLRGGAILDADFQPLLVNSPPRDVPGHFRGRHAETSQVVQFLRDDAQRMLTIVGRSGIGKTAMVCRLLRALQQRVPCDGHPPVPVRGVVYLGARSTRSISMANLFGGLCKLLPQAEAARLGGTYRELGATTTGKMNELLAEFDKLSAIVLLDNFEDLVDVETQRLTDTELAEALIALLRAPHHGIKVVITTWLAPQDFTLVEPGLQRRLDLDQGLGEGDAADVLRELDADGRIGLRQESNRLLAEAWSVTMGIPKALELLFGNLSANRDTSLEDILRHTSKALPHAVIESLVGETFSRLDPPSQQIMQALAVFGRPVPVEAVQYLLAPYVLGTEIVPRLKKLFNMHLVGKGCSGYHLHEVERRYSQSRIPIETADRNATNPAYVLFALRARAVEYYVMARRDMKDWNCLEDLDPIFAEIELRCENGEHTEAARIGQEIDFDYLLMWGHHGEVIKLHERLLPHLTDPKLRACSLGSLGLALEGQGKYAEAIERCKEALTVAQEIGNARIQAANLNTMAICYARLGETDEAIECHERALIILGYRSWLRRMLGRIFGLPQQIAAHLTNLALRRADKGEWDLALKLAQESVTISLRAHTPREKAYYLASTFETCGRVLMELDRFVEAREQYREAVRIADTVQCVQEQSFSHYGLACTALYSDDLASACSEAKTALGFDFPDNNYRVAVVYGIILARQGEIDDSRRVLNLAIDMCERMTALTPYHYDAMDMKGVALTAIACWMSSGTEQEKVMDDAEMAFRGARRINCDPGVLHRVTRLLRAISLECSLMERVLAVPSRSA